MILLKKSIKFYLTLNFVVCFLFTAFLVGIRTYQLANFTDYRTGFYNGPDYLNYCFFGGVFLLLVALFILSFCGRYDSVVDLSGNLLLKIISIIVAVFSGLYAFFVLFNSKNYGVKDILIPILLFVANILLSVGFIYLFFRLKQRKEHEYGDILFLFPVLWACIRLISIFLNNMIMFSVQENVLNLLKTCSVCIFLFCMSKFFAGFCCKTTTKRMNIFGFFSLSLVCCSALPRYIVFFSSGFTRNCYLNVSDLASLDFVLSIFILVFLVSYFLKLKK